MPSIWTNPDVMSALISGGMQLGGGLIAGAGQGKQNAAQAQATQAQNLYNARMGQANNYYDAINNLNASLMQQGYNRDVKGAELASQDPLSVQRSRQQQALMAAVLPGLRNVGITPPKGLKGYTPTFTGGFRIPEGGFGADTLKYFSPESRAAAEGQFYSAAAPFMTPPNLSDVGYGSAGYGPTQGAMGARSSFENLQERQRQAQIDAISGYKQAGDEALGQYTMDSDAERKKREEGKKKGGFWRSLLGTALPIAASFIPGVGPIAGLAIGALAGGAGSAIAGGNPLTGAAMGAAGSQLSPNSWIRGGGPSYVGNQVGGVANRLNALG